MDQFFKFSKRRNYTQYFGIILIPFVTFLLGYTVGYEQVRQTSYGVVQQNGNFTTVPGLPNYPSNSYHNPKDVDLSLFWQVWDMLERLYIDQKKIDYTQMTYGAIRGVVESLKDPYTIYMDPKETEDFKNNLSGDLEGIGAELSVKNDHLVIVSPLKNSPAEAAGLKPGDIIYKIGEELTTNMSLSEAVGKIRGEKGSSVSLSILRGNQNEPLEFTIKRQEIKVPSVSWEMKGNDIAYISINQFGDDTTQEFSKAINEILLKKAKGVILDLRFNGGGYLDGAVDIVSEFVESGIVTSISKRENKDELAHEEQKVHGHARLAKLPLLVLVNEGSASASEIVAGAIQDYGRGKLLGQKTFGKGSVQELQPLSDGSSIRITIAKWYTPKNRSVENGGLTPDIEIMPEEDDGQNEKDTQLDKAIELLSEQIQAGS